MPAAAAPSPTRRRRRLPLAALGLAGLLLAFGAGVVHLFQLRFDAGDVYPPYSTLRSDPLGTKAFFAGLQGLPGLNVERSLRPTASLGLPVMSRRDGDHGEARFTCFYLGANPDGWPYLLHAADARRLHDIALRGGRVVVTFLPTAHLPTAASLDHAREVRATPDPHKAGEKKSSRPPLWESKVSDEPDLSEEWGIDFRRAEVDPKKAAAMAGLFTGGTPAVSPASAADGPALARDGRAFPARHARDVPTLADEQPVAWHTAADFDTASRPARQAGWRTLYTRAGRPVIVARPVGPAGGELILASDTYFLSNEGLHADPHPALLAALVGPGGRVLFDESHLGISEHPGMVTLARRYRLQGALAALGLLAVLFVWRNAVSLVPPRPPEADRAPEEDVLVTGRDAGAGFLNLLRRGIAPRDLPARCLAQWRQNLSPQAGAVAEARQLATPDHVARLQEALEAAGGKAAPAALYRAMCAALKR